MPQSSSLRLALWTSVVGFAAGCAQTVRSNPRADDTAPLMEASAPDAALDATSIDFGGEDAPAAEEALLTLSNQGDGLLVLSSVTGEGSFALRSGGDGLLEPNESAIFIIAFTPAAPGEAIGAFTVETNDPDQARIRVDLRGYAQMPRIAIEPADFDFGVVPIGCEASEEILVFNTGNQPLVVEDAEWIPTSEDFSLDIDVPFTVAPGEAHVALIVTFAPTTEAHETALLRLYSNDPMSVGAPAAQQGMGVDDGDSPEC